MVAKSPTALPSGGWVKVRGSGTIRCRTAVAFSMKNGNSNGWILTLYPASRSLPAT